MTMAETVTLSSQVRMSVILHPPYPATVETVEIIATTSSTPQEPVMAKIRPKAVLSCSMRPVTRPLPEAVAAKAAVHLYNK